MSFPPVDDDERVVPIDFGIQWSVGAPMPVLLKTDYDAMLFFYLRDDDPSDSEIGIVRWRGCHAVLFGHPNDEVIDGHRLWSHGELDVYGASEVVNSSWIAHLERVNSVHGRHVGGWHSRMRHFILSFKDSTFECIAEDYTVEASKEISTGAALLEYFRRRGLIE